MKYINLLWCLFIITVPLYGYQTSMGKLLRLLQTELDQEITKDPSGQDLSLDKLIVNAAEKEEMHEVESSVAEEKESVTSSEASSNETLPTPPITDFKESREKDWLLALYIAGQNNLSKFVKLNVKSLTDVGSGERAHAVAQIDELGSDEVTRVHIQKKKVRILGEYEPTEEYMSGTSESLYQFVAWALEHFPAKKICLVIWNHGSGAIDPHMWDRAWFFDRDSDVFNFNTNTGLLELRPSVKTTDELCENDFERGIAFNEEQSVYLTNSDLTDVVERIQDDLLGGREIDVLAFDACLMSMIEVACQVNFSVKYMVASEEIVPGNGLPYSSILDALNRYQMSPLEFARYMTQAYAEEYEDTFADFTLSALAMEKMHELKLRMNDVASSLMRLTDSEYGEEFLDMLYAIRVSRKMSTAFYNRDYIDVNHTLDSIRTRVARFKKLDEVADEVGFLQSSIKEAQDLIKEVVVSNVHGYNPAQASGISMYWPRNSLHSSYQSSIFGKTTRWKHLLQRYLTSVK